MAGFSVTVMIKLRFYPRYAEDLSPDSRALRGAWIALAAVCFFWGTTYLGIRIALEGLPPSLLVAVRFLLSGSLILTWAALRGWTFPRGRELLVPAGTGLLTLAAGNYFLTLAETYVSSGLAALIITVGPFWMVGLDAAIPGGDRFRPKALIGMAVGFAGAIWLIGPDALEHGWTGSTLPGFLLLQLSCFSWSLGSLLQKRAASAAHPILVGGLQQFAAGTAMALACLVNLNFKADWTPRVLAAVLYLAFFGSIVAYSAFLVALSRLPVAVVSIYTYINPIVAVTLGWLFYNEDFGTRQIAAMLVIFSGVFLVSRFSRKP
jgi:drug/metabolite transporter (DMT)-like permease